MDDSQSMNCLQCVRKHLANSLSYAKEIIAGHGMGADPDHRPDLLGELGNAEHHLETMPELSEPLHRVTELRRRLEGQGYVPNAGMLEELRNLWLSLEGKLEHCRSVTGNVLVFTVLDGTDMGTGELG